MSHEEIMSQLRDIHAGPPVSFWPPAPGYYMVVGLALFVLLLIFAVTRYVLRQRIKKILLYELSRVEADFSLHNDKAELQASISALFRRLAFFKDTTLAKNSELNAVMPVLEKITKDRQHLGTLIDLLEEGRYQKNPPIDGAKLISLSREQIKRCRI